MFFIITNQKLFLLLQKQKTMVFLKGYLVGLALIILVGPVFFTLLQSTLQYNYKSGLAVALGIFISDIICVLLCSFGAASFFNTRENQVIIGLLGAFILIGFGLNYLLRPPQTQEINLSLSSSDYVGFFAKGFLVNFVNPFVFLVWLGIIANAATTYGYTYILAIYLTGALLGILTTDSLKAIFAHKIKPFLQVKHFQYLYRIIGVLLLVFGIRFLYFSLS